MSTTRAKSPLADNRRSSWRSSDFAWSNHGTTHEEVIVNAKINLCQFLFKTLRHCLFGLLLTSASHPDKTGRSLFMCLIAFCRWWGLMFEGVDNQTQDISGSHHSHHMPCFASVRLHVVFWCKVICVYMECTSYVRHQSCLSASNQCQLVSDMQPVCPICISNTFTFPLLLHLGKRSSRLFKDDIKLQESRHITKECAAKSQSCSLTLAGF